VAPLVVLTAALACGGEDGEAQLERATEALDRARAAVETAREDVEERGAAAEEATRGLDQARDRLATARRKLAEVEEQIDLTATDAVLFRSVQKRLLDDARLQDVAIVANVDKGVVTLKGNVARAGQRDRAVEIADSVPGVSSVKSLIVVSVSARE
jgi:osmotically-inducible protein OsmY